jgi:di/tricarboxylate transporter
MTPEAWTTAIVIVAILAGLAAELAPPSALVFGGVVVLLITDVIDAPEAFSGFSNPAPFTVGALLIVAAAISKTGALRPFTQRLLGTTGHTRRPLLRLLAPVTLASSLMNNIPLVAMMIPDVLAWARRRGADRSRFLLPLSYGAILGGVLTLIGTSTNLVVAGQMSDLGLEPFGFFELGRVGLPLALTGVLTIVLLSPRLLKSRTRSSAELGSGTTDYSIEMEVIPDGPLVGLTVDEAGLRHLEGVFLVSIETEDTFIAPATPSTLLHGRNILRFVGKVDQVLDLDNVRGLRHAVHDQVTELNTRGPTYFTAAIGGGSPLVGKTLKEVGFRSRYQAAVVAVHRAGERVDAKLGEVPLRIGDALVIVSDPGFKDRWASRPDFLLVANLQGEVRPPAPGGGRTLLVLGTMVVLAALGIVPILQASLVAATLLIALRVLSPAEARRALDLDVLGVIAAAFGLAAAVESSGLGHVVAEGMVTSLDVFGPVGVLVGVVLATMMMTELITNNAAALLLLPIALSAAGAADITPRGMAVAVAVAASTSFLTPIGYQTNTMVYGPGGYRFSDYAKMGAPLTLTTIVALAILIPLMYGI